MTKSPRKNVPDMRIKLGTACMPSGHASDRATAPVSACVILHFCRIQQEVSGPDQPEYQLLTKFNCRVSKSASVGLSAGIIAQKTVLDLLDLAQDLEPVSKKQIRWVFISVYCTWQNSN